MNHNSFYEKQSGNTFKTKYTYSLWFSNSIPRNLTHRNIKLLVHNDICTRLFIEALTWEKNWTEGEFTSTDKCFQKIELLSHHEMICSYYNECLRDLVPKLWDESSWGATLKSQEWYGIILIFRGNSIFQHLLTFHEQLAWSNSWFQLERATTAYIYEAGIQWLLWCKSKYYAKGKVEEGVKTAEE